jgi:vitamin K-dependent gamma-carboxylase
LLPARPGALPAAPRGRVDLAGLAVFRVLFGLVMVWAVARYFAHGWIAAQFDAPRVFFPYEGLEWVRPLPHPWMHVLFAGIGVCAALVAIGLWYRPAIVLFTLGFTWAHLCDKTNHLNHYHLVTLVSFLMWFLPLDRALSPASARRPERGPPGAHPAGLALLRFQVGLVYVFAGLAKLQGDWLLRGEPLHTWLLTSDDVPLLGPWLGERGVAVVASWAAAAFDLAIPFFLLSRRTWRPAFALTVLFHAATALLFPIGLFPVFMTVFATVLLPADWPRRLLGRFAPPLPPPEPVPPPRPLVRAAVAAWVVVQVVTPVRFLALPDDVLWAERGFRFSWRVMLVDKTGIATFRVRDPVRGVEREVDPRGVLTRVQDRMMSTQPDMILQFARRLARDEPGSEVRADAFVAFNGRPSTRLVDPTVDLARWTGRGLPPRWVLPRPD